MDGERKAMVPARPRAVVERVQPVAEERVRRGPDLSSVPYLGDLPAPPYGSMLKAKPKGER